MLFVFAPLYISSAREGFAGVDPRLEYVARTLEQALRGFLRAFSRKGPVAVLLILLSLSIFVVARLIAGISPDSGRVIMDGEDVTTLLGISHLPAGSQQA